MAALEKLGLTKVYDLRTDDKIAATPDVLPAGVLSEQISRPFTALQVRTAMLLLSIAGVDQ